MSVKNIAVIIFCFAKIMVSYASGVDSTGELFISLSKRNIGCYDVAFDRQGPFGNNSIVDMTIGYHTALWHKSKTALNIQSAFAFEYQSVNYYEKDKKILSATQNINTFRLTGGIRVSPYIERQLYGYRKSKLLIGTGLSLNGTIWNNTKQYTVVFKTQQGVSADSIIVSYNKNKRVSVNPFLQLKYNMAVGNKMASLTLRYMFSTNNINDEDIISYSVYDASASGFYSSKGKFLDTGNYFEIVLGLTLCR